MDYHLPAALAMAAAMGHTPSWTRVVRTVAQCSGYIAARGTSTATHLTGCRCGRGQSNPLHRFSIDYSMQEICWDVGPFGWPPPSLLVRLQLRHRGDHESPTVDQVLHHS